MNTIRKVDPYADATATDVPPFQWLTDELVVGQHDGEKVHRDPARERSYFWQRGGFFETFDQCADDIERVLAEDLALSKMINIINGEEA